MAEIAEAVGISRRSIFNYFPSKEALLTPMADHEAFVAEFRKKLLGRPAGEKIFESMRVVLGEMIPKSLALTAKIPGPEVRKALQSDAAIAYNRTYWANQMQEVAEERLAGDPNAAVKARFVGALTGQVLTELGALNKTEGESHNPAAAVQRVIGSLQDLFD
jgi:AcrR family transcriptional regulator